MAHKRQSWPDSGLGFQAKGIQTFQVAPSSLGFFTRWIILATPWSTTLSSNVMHLIVGPYAVQIWSRNARNFEPTKPSYCTVWIQGAAVCFEARPPALPS